MMVVFNDGTCHKVQPVLYNPLIKSRTPHKWRIRWWTGWLPSCALSACSSASEPPRRCSPLRCPQGRRPPPADGGGTEGWSRTCLQISQVVVLAVLLVWVNKCIDRVIELFSLWEKVWLRYLGSSCSLQRSSPSPSDLRSLKPSTCESYRPPGRRGWGYRSRSWCSSSWSPRMTS